MEGRYPEVTEEDFARAQFILLSSEPYPFKPTQQQVLQQQYPHKKVLLADGEIFSWYGSRMLKAGSYYMEMLKRM